MTDPTATSSEPPPSTDTKSTSAEGGTDNTENSTAHVHQQTQAQLDAIEKEIRENQPLTSPRIDVLSLRKFYTTEDTAAGQNATTSASSSEGFDMGVQILRQTYDTIRTVRGDGNCYYRAFLYSLCEALRSNPDEWKRISTFGMCVRRYMSTCIACASQSCSHPTS